MEFVHMKDMRTASFEPTNAFSRYKWQDGLASIIQDQPK